MVGEGTVEQYVMERKGRWPGGRYKEISSLESWI